MKCHLPAVDDEVDGAIEDDQSVAGGDHDVHLVTPYISGILV